MGIRRCKLSKKVQLRLLEYFVAEVTARTAADLTGINYHSAHLFYQKIRELIVANTQDEDLLSGEVEVDESYFGGKRKGKRGRGSAGKVPVFGLLKRGGKVHVLPVPDAKRTTLIPIIRSKITPDSIVYTDSFHTYDVLDVSEFKHFRINHSQLFADRHNHINGIENFWNQAKRVLRKYNGIPKASFYLFLKECEFRFNFGSPAEQLTILKRWANSN
jgi:transposase